MSKEEQLLEYWRELSPEAQEQVLQLAQSLKPQPEFVPQTPLGKKLWEIRQRAIKGGMKLLTMIHAGAWKLRNESIKKLNELIDSCHLCRRGNATR
ncbi:hypothetical protein [Brasilonema sp. UFV-L1]|uniref:hypothetical protein n=1 Tax=Brasilonema sp. UFV-L1 TaxID=2234130 RepID=UPI00145DCDA6|nr:hypothetical protein [Brasilonema sp. UFV-L1]